MRTYDEDEEWLDNEERRRREERQEEEYDYWLEMQCPEPLKCNDCWGDGFVSEIACDEYGYREQVVRKCDSCNGTGLADKG